jgi:hypothetical protein
LPKLSEDLRAYLRLFAFYLANGTVDWELLGEEWDYSSLFANPSDLEQVFAIWSNVLELDDEGNVLNPGAAKRRAAQYIRRFVDPSYIVEPPFAEWELELLGG